MEMMKFSLIALVSMVMPIGLALIVPSESTFFLEVLHRIVMPGATKSTPPLPVQLADEPVEGHRGQGGLALK